MYFRTLALLGLVVSLGLIGCDDGVEPIGTGESPSKTDASPHGMPVKADMPPGHGAGATPKRKLAWTSPASWKKLPPRVQFHYARMSLPLVKKDLDAKLDVPVLTVSWTPRGLGDPDSNIDRWVGMVAGEGGKPATRADATIATRKVHGLQVKTVVVSGSYGGGGMGDPHASGGRTTATLFAAIVFVPDGVPFYIKVAGPKASMDAARADIEKFIDSLHLE